MAAQRILRNDLNLTPFHIQVKQRLKPADYVARMEMCERFLQADAEDEDFINRVWFSDESHFYLDGKIHARNAIYWANGPPQFVLKRPLHSQRCTAWMALSSQGVVGPFWIEEDGETVNVNSTRYLAVLRKFKSSLGRKHLNLNEQIFMQDGATAHTARV